ncbi:MAG TPA: DUF2934 domain-containing protein [Prosthecobacter sp.]|nr:DUF2934 domain-containing protein [Prosthecobacter sp.]
MSEELAPPPDTATDVPFEEDIARLAYRYDEEENRPDGRADEHWHRAAQVLRGPVPPWTVESGAGDA